MTRTITLAAWLLALLPAAATAQQHEAGGYTILYSVLPADRLHPEVARRYGVERSERRALLTVIVRRTQGDGSDPAVPARIEGTAQSLLGEPLPLRFREVRGEDAIDYLAEIPLRRPDTWRFTLQVRPEGGSTETVRFQREFPAD